jgi:hypothetical protein
MNKETIKTTVVTEPAKAVAINEVVEVLTSIKEINPNAPTLNYLGNVPVMTEKIPAGTSELKEYETVRKAHYVPERDDRMPSLLKALVVLLGIVCACGIIYAIKMS